MNEVTPSGAFIGTIIIIIMFGWPIWYVISRRLRSKVKVARKLKETKCTCQVCGNIWHYGKGEYLQNKGQRMINSANQSSNCSSDLLCCSGCWPAAFLPKAQQVPVKDLTKCPKCNSSAITREEVIHGVSK